MLADGLWQNAEEVVRRLAFVNQQWQWAQANVTSSNECLILPVADPVSVFRFIHEANVGLNTQCL